ncbi:sodium/hydrogen exchanger 9B2-like isoform X2 [Periplaneta americana]|uniref:sodium/hydrogen exchanger 9B2-like isoform X2 n=1 Tax=Periplaneta americana TaxID=6978 RepID=UPI0037E82902
MENKNTSHPAPTEYDVLNVATLNSTNSLEYENTSRTEDSVESTEEPPSRLKRWICCCCGERCERFWHAVTSHPLCPSNQAVTRLLTLVVLGLTLWGSIYSTVGTMAGPQGQMFKIGFLGVASHFAGWLISFVGLPPLLGMLLMGILLRNVEFIILSGHFMEVAADLRQMSLAIILIRAGLGLDPVALRRLGGMVTRLAVAPSLAEVIFIAIMTHFLLGLPWVWGFLLGSVLAAVSPAVVIPCLFSLEDRGYGKSKGIPTLVIAAASFDDIIAISAFGIVISLIFTAHSTLAMLILRGPLGILFGMVGGIGIGIFLRYVPNKDDPRVTMFRTILLAFLGAFFMFGSEAVDYEGAGPLGAIVTAFVASNGWKTKTFDGKAAVADNFLVLWSVFQPVLFGLIGTEINLFILDPVTVGIGIASLFVALAARIVTSVLVAAGGNLTWKEKLFVAFAWFPKATVQGTKT